MWEGYKEASTLRQLLWIRVRNRMQKKDEKKAHKVCGHLFYVVSYFGGFKWMSNT